MAKWWGCGNTLPGIKFWYNTATNSFYLSINTELSGIGTTYRFHEKEIETDEARDLTVMLNPEISDQIFKAQKALIEMKKYVKNNNNIVEFSIEGLVDHVIFEELEATLYVFRAPQ